jgi:hypothetical protein
MHHLEQQTPQKMEVEPQWKCQLQWMSHMEGNESTFYE